MAQDWYAQIDGVTEGPFEMRRLRELAAEGRVTGDTPVRLGDEDWRRAGQINGLLEPSPSDPAFSVPGGSSYAIPVAPSLNDTREWRMLADTAAAPAADSSRPLPRRTPEPATSRGTASPAPKETSRAMLVLAVTGVAVAGLVAAVVWLLSG